MSHRSSRWSSQWRRLLLACSITLSLTLLISVFPLIAHRTSENKGDVSVFHPVPVKRLSSDVIVDTMLSLGLSLQVKSVAWKGSVLSVDLSTDGYGDAEEVWIADLQRLLELAFVRTDNVSRVLVRFVTPVRQTGDSDETKLRLLAAADVRKTDSWLSTDLSKLNGAESFDDEIWRKRLRLSVSKL
ncbi:hypothetical protein [Paenibacillus sp. OV219]|uniref:hypothetical protein n=1 Tax=Paenibacillus sp. OV219 TaxID=1884377 RepID=UPI0008C942DC|nr:hypothetical protein [Paenibacillus sp. OV219]SEN24989.1 hypothetical protein SAMN05518847_102515 [Paenibacillus sp. OV219]